MNYDLVLPQGILYRISCSAFLSVISTDDYIRLIYHVSVTSEKTIARIMLRYKCGLVCKFENHLPSVFVSLFPFLILIRTGYHTFEM